MEIEVGLKDPVFSEKLINCTFCGAKFSTVFISHHENNSDQVLYCPECGEGYFVKAASPIVDNAIQLVSPRMDFRDAGSHSER